MNPKLGSAAPRVERLVLPRVSGPTAMGKLLERWVTDTDDETIPVGQWAIERRHDHRIIGGASLLPCHLATTTWKLPGSSTLR